MELHLSSAQPGPVDPPAVAILNAAGEQERESRSRRENAMDAFLAAAATLLILWPLAFGWGVLGHAPVAESIAKGLIVVVAIWALVGSPFWHRDSLTSYGLGSPARLRDLLTDRGNLERWRIAAVFIAIFGGLLWFSLADWPDAGRFYRLPKELRLSPVTLWQWVAVGAAGLFGATLVATCVVRYDNIGPAFRLALKVSIVLLAYVTLAAWLYRGDKAFAKFELRDHSIDAAAHMFWGAIQQLIFTGYFATRIRKAFPPSHSPTNIVPASRRFGAVIFGGIICALTAGPAVWALLRVARGPIVPISLLWGCIAFAFPVGAVWAFFFCRDKKRLLVATLTGSFFALIHIDSYGLVLLTGIMGTSFAYAAMEDRYRNLAAFAFTHGLLGATVAKLFGSKGILGISLSVGPWSVKNPSIAVLWVPLAAALFYAALAARARALRDPPTPRQTP